ncbi:MAG TPA: alpha/beta fold hydrolase, partial [Acidimicrobiales bacterium]|nr:alpha/beta fold hydrolase [Acidimicrobiales bacterium]
VDQSPTPASTPVVAAPPERAAARAPRQRSLAFTITGAVLVVAAFLLLLRMTAQERGGPTHEFVSIGDGIPATLYVPYPDEDDGLPVAPPKGERAPVIVLAHGYSADRASMSGLARSYTEAGYAVLSFDFRGHGANTHRFQGDLRDDFAAAVDWAETSPYVDGENIAVMGHSMGAGAALDFATLDARPKAVIPLSGGWVVNDGVVPGNTLFVVAENDPDRIHDRQQELADQLTQLGGTVGQVEVGGSDHITVLRKDKTVAAVTEFLDPILGIERADGDTPGIEDPRYKTALLYLIVAFALVALLGSVVGRAAPAGPQTDPAGPVWGGFALLVGALVVSMPVLGAGQFDLLPIGAGQPIVIHAALASALLWGLRGLAQRGQLTGRVAEWIGPDRPWLSLRSSGWTGLVAAGIVIALLIPLGPVVHRFVPTPQRAVYWVVMAAIALPFFAAFHGLIRRGEGWTAILIGAIGRVVLIAVLLLGLAVGVLPMVISLVIPLLVLQYVLLELFAGGCYASSRNTTVIAIVDAVVIGWVATTLTPVG